MSQITLPGIIPVPSPQCVRSACFSSWLSGQFSFNICLSGKKNVCRVSKQKQHFLQRGGTGSHRRSKITVIYRFAVVQSCVGVFPLEMYPAFRPADLQSPHYAALVQMKKMAALANSAVTFFCIKNRIIGTR